MPPDYRLRANLNSFTDNWFFYTVARVLSRGSFMVAETIQVDSVSKSLEADRRSTCR
jgi:hypothetical protein